VGLWPKPSLRRPSGAATLRRWGRWRALKGSSGNMGAHRISTICAELQNAGHSGKPEDAAGWQIASGGVRARAYAALAAEGRG